MPRMVKMEKDGIVTEVVASAFRNVHSRRGYKLVDDDTPTDPQVLGLGEGEDLDSYKTRRDEARKQADEQRAAFDRRVAEQAKAEQEARDKARAEALAAQTPQGPLTGARSGGTALDA